MKNLSLSRAIKEKLFYAYAKHTAIDQLRSRVPSCTVAHADQCHRLSLFSRLIESMIGLRPRQGNLRQVFRLFTSRPRLCRGCRLATSLNIVFLYKLKFVLKYFFISVSFLLPLR